MMNVFIIVLITITVFSFVSAFMFFKENRSLKKNLSEEQDQFCIVRNQRNELRTFETLYNELLEQCGGETKGKLLFHSIMEQLVDTEIDWFNPKMKSFFFIQEVKDRTYLFEKKEYHEPVVVATIYSHNKSIHLSTAFYKTDAFLEIQKKIQDKSVVQIVSLKAS